MISRVNKYINIYVMYERWLFRQTAISALNGRNHQTIKRWYYAEMITHCWSIWMQMQNTKCELTEMTWAHVRPMLIQQRTITPFRKTWKPSCATHLMFVLRWAARRKRVRDDISAEDGFMDYWASLRFHFHL